MNKNVMRARLVDEPAVKSILEDNYPSWNFIQGSTVDDFQHVDLKMYIGNNIDKCTILDIKRNNSENWNNDKITFTFKNSKGDIFPFNETGKLIFIDERIDKHQLILISFKKMETIVTEYVDKGQFHYSKSGNKSCYIHLNKDDLINKGYTLNIPVNIYKFLERNRDERIFV